MLAAFVARAGAEGWSERCLRTAAEGVGEDLARVAFPRGVADVIRYFAAGADAGAARALDAHDLAGLRMRERIATAVRLRLEEHRGHKPALRTLIAALATPRFAGLGARALYATVDALWDAVGDRSSDFSFYTKRALLAAVYTTTALCWLDDDSPDSAASWRFLDDRIAEVMGIQRLRGRIEAIARPFARRTRRPAAFGGRP